MIGMAAAPDPVARAEAVLDLLQADINVRSAPSTLRVVGDSPFRTDWSSRNSSEESSQALERSPEPPPASGSGSGASPSSPSFHDEVSGLFSMDATDRIDLGQDPLSGQATANLLHFWDGSADQSSESRVSGFAPSLAKPAGGDLFSTAASAEASLTSAGSAA